MFFLLRRCFSIWDNPLLYPNLHHPTSLLLSWPQNALNMQSCPVLLHNFYQSSRNKVHLSKGAPSTSTSIGHIDRPKHVKIPSQKKYDRNLQKLSTWALFLQPQHEIISSLCYPTLACNALHCAVLRGHAMPYVCIYTWSQLIACACLIHRMLVNPACLDRESLLAEFAEEFPVLWWARTAIRCLAEFCVLTDCLCLVKRARSRTANAREISWWSQFAAFNSGRVCNRRAMVQ